MPKTVVDTVQSIETIGQSQYESYVANRLETLSCNNGHDP